jgi:hypothetical protein
MNLEEVPHSEVNAVRNTLDTPSEAKLLTRPPAHTGLNQRSAPTLYLLPF